MTRWLLRVAWLLLALGGVMSWGLAMGWLNPIHPPDLEALPLEFGGLRTLEIYPVDSSLLGDLPPDRYTFRRIGVEEEDQGELYVAYFERGRRWSGRPHDLEVCYRAAGWELLQSRVLWTSSGAMIQAQDFRKETATIRVFHWIQQPGLMPGKMGMGAQLQRMRGPAILRQDVASNYLQFPIEDAPPDERAVVAAEALIQGLEALWR